MYKLKITDKAKKTIESYTIAYRDAFLDLYTDTGLGYAEEVIKEQYWIGADTLRTTLYHAITEALSPDIMLGYSYNQAEGKYLVTTSIGKRRIFLEYTEDIEGKIRTLQEISIVRK